MKKFGASNCLTASIALVTLVLSILLISGGIWLSRNVDKEHCGSAAVVQAQWFAIGIGIVGVVVSIAGFVGSCFRIRWLLFVYLVALFLLILLLLAATIILFVEAWKQDGNAPNHLQEQVVTPKSWEKISSCFSRSKVCTNRANHYPFMDNSFPLFLDPVESGCCSPPKECNFTFQNGTTWLAPAAANSTNLDCKRWSNDVDKLCFACDSCKAGYVRYYGSPDFSRHGRKGVAVGSLVVLLIFIVIFYIGYRAFKNVGRREHKNKVETAMAS